MSDASDNPLDFSHVRFLIIDESADARRLLVSMLVRSGAQRIEQDAGAVQRLSALNREVAAGK